MPNKLRRALLPLAAASLILTVLCACTGGKKPDTQTSGGTVTVGIAQDLDNLDPHLANTAGKREVLFNLFEGLVKAGPDGSVVPAVASGYEVSGDGLTYTFTLRQGVRFHDGSPVTAEDVVYSLQRCAGSENGGVPLISAFSNAAEISAPDESHVTVKLKAANLEFINSMIAPIIPKGSGEDIAAKLIGTGPFKFVSYAPQDELVMERFDDYWGERAKLERVSFKISTNINNLVMGLKGGTVDMAVHLPNTLRSEVEGQFTVLRDTMKLVQALYLNNAEKPFDDVRVRQALYYAVDVPEIIDLVCDGDGVATGTSMYPAHVKYFMPELAENYPRSVEKAKSLLAEAGYPDGFDMTITVPSNYPQHVDAAQVIADQLKAVGINASLRSVEWEAWVSDVYQGRQFQSTVCAIAASDMTAREMLQRYMSGNKKNFINFTDSAYDDAVSSAMAAMDIEEQIALYKRAETILNEQAASVWLQDMCELVVLDPRLDGYTFYQTYVIDMSTVYYK